MSKSNSSSSGVGFTSLLLLTFIILKLCKVINWSWWWVLSPFWITAGIALIILAVYVILKLSEKEKPKPVYKSKWQERLEEMQKRQRSAK